MKYSQENLNLNSEITLKFKKPLFFKNKKLSCGNMSQLALEAGEYSFSAINYKDNILNFRT